MHCTSNGRVFIAIFLDQKTLLDQLVDLLFHGSPARRNANDCASSCGTCASAERHPKPVVTVGLTAAWSRSSRKVPGCHHPRRCQRSVDCTGAMWPPCCLIEATLRSSSAISCPFNSQEQPGAVDPGVWLAVCRKPNRSRHPHPNSVTRVTHVLPRNRPASSRNWRQRRMGNVGALPDRGEGLQNPSIHLPGRRDVWFDDSCIFGYMILRREIMKPLSNFRVYTGYHCYTLDVPATLAV